MDIGLHIHEGVLLPYLLIQQTLFAIGKAHADTSEM